jgi:hypothetical protein
MDLELKVCVCVRARARARACVCVHWQHLSQNKESIGFLKENS